MNPLRTLLLAAALPLAAPLLHAQVDAFEFDARRVPVGRQYEYVKSNRDGSNAGRVSLYVAAGDRIESLKWSAGDTAAALVAAVLDWERFSVARLESWWLGKDREPVLRARLDADAAARVVRLSLDPARPIPISAWPWHSYDFDFASLNLALAHLRRPEAGFGFQRADITYAEDGPPFADLGAVRVDFVRRERRNGISTRRYVIGGPGLLGREGVLWVAVDGAHIVEYELPIPDEPGYADGRLRLASVRTMSAAEWEAYKRHRVSGAP